ncbi:MAG: phosphoadenosine phosphosulfate reductase family protein [Clostridia bacterium]|nr:phosphoadenosine phosphosulfate reductase family protein [Clostridia bacterium]
MKKGPMGELKEYPIIATMVEESKLREQAWLKSGCNSFDKKIQSKPLSFWTKQDVLEYLKLNNIKIAECYGEIIPVDKQGNPTFEDLKDRYAFSGVQRSGCIFCLFGISQDTQKGGINRFEHLRITQPKLFDYCMRGGVFNDEGIWVPHKGLGLAFVIEWLNRNLSKTLKNGKKSLYIKGLDLSDYKQQIDEAFKKLEEIEPTRKKWLKE